MIGKEPKEKSEMVEKPKKQSMAILRLQKDLQAFHENKLHYASIEFPDASNIESIIIRINLKLNE